jgi:hypothetical protein
MWMRIWIWIWIWTWWIILRRLLLTPEQWKNETGLLVLTLRTMSNQRENDPDMPECQPASDDDLWIPEPRLIVILALRCTKLQASEVLWLHSLTSKLAIEVVWSITPQESTSEVLRISTLTIKTGFWGFLASL